MQIAADLLAILNEIRMSMQTELFVVKKLLSPVFINRIFALIACFGIISETNSFFGGVCNYFQN